MVTHREYSSLKIVLNDLSQTTVKTWILQFSVNYQQNQTCSQATLASGLVYTKIQLNSSFALSNLLFLIEIFTNKHISENEGSVDFKLAMYQIQQNRWLSQTPAINQK